MFSRAMVTAALTSFAIQTPTPSTADWDWLNQCRDAAFEALMPLDPPSSPFVVYRSHRDLYQDVQERYFTIGFVGGQGFDKDRLTATVVVPLERSIQQQLLDAHMMNRRSSFKSLLPLVAVRRLTFSAEKCPAVRTQADALSKTQLSLSERDAMFLHPVVHRIVIDMGATKIDATVYDPHNPIVRWATQTVEAMLGCAG